jgi:hypothetical protein
LLNLALSHSSNWKTNRVWIIDTPLALSPKTEVEAKRYHYLPCNSTPMSPEAFIYYFNSPVELHRQARWLHRIPKKLKETPLSSLNPDGLAEG